MKALYNNKVTIAEVKAKLTEGQNLLYELIKIGAIEQAKEVLSKTSRDDDGTLNFEDDDITMSFGESEEEAFEKAFVSIIKFQDADLLRGIFELLTEEEEQYLASIYSDHLGTAFQLGNGEIIQILREKGFGFCNLASPSLEELSRLFLYLKSELKGKITNFPELAINASDYFARIIDTYKDQHMIDTLRLFHENIKAPRFVSPLSNTQISDNNFNAILDAKIFDINQQDIAGNTALHIHIANADLEKVTLLLRNGANISIDNDEGITPFVLAVNADPKFLLEMQKYLPTQLVIPSKSTTKGFSDIAEPGSGVSSPETARREVTSEIKK